MWAQYLGGVEGAIMLAKNSWLGMFPLIMSDTVLMVAVRMSTGTPEAMSSAVSVCSSPHWFMTRWQDVTACAGFCGATSDLTSCGEIERLHKHQLIKFLLTTYRYSTRTTRSETSEGHGKWR